MDSRGHSTEISHWELKTRQLIQVHQIGVSLIKYIKFTIILDCLNGREGQLRPSSLSILFSALGGRGVLRREGKESRMGREER